MITTAPETGRITLTLKADTIKALRLLALLKDESQNDVAEALLIAGGLHNAVDSEWSAGKVGEPKPVAMVPVQVLPTLKPVLTPAPQEAASISHAVPSLPKPATPRGGLMPEIPEINPNLEEEPPW